MFDFRIFTYIAIILAIVLTFRMAKRRNIQDSMKKIYVGVVVFFVILSFFGSVIILFSLINKTTNAILYGERYYVKVIDFESHISHSFESGSTTMYTPIVEFVLKDGTVVRKKLNFSTEDKVFDKYYSIIYIKESDQIITLGFILLLSYFGTLLFFIVLGVLLIGIILYALNMPMSNYLSKLKLFALKAFIPFIMISFELLLIYTLFL